ncbi:MAG: hypothetical protein KatS3mg129_1069 [Leptospiraceae bacterium]|nr:MAG: hypothetical protein KatS3mg129_1069 [Leptospiraceae bacterium]
MMNLKQKVKYILDHLKDITIQYYKENLISLIIFGSVGRGTFREDSDIDILIIANNLPDGRLKRVEQFHSVEIQIENLLNQYNLKQMYLSPIFKTPMEAQKGSPLFLDMIEDSIILYDKNNFFRSILHQLQSNLNKLGAKRIYKGNIWYWNLKQDYKFGEEIKLL